MRDAKLDAVVARSTLFRYIVREIEKQTCWQTDKGRETYGERERESERERERESERVRE